MVFPIAGGNESKGYDVENSLRFNDGDSPQLSLSTGTTNKRKFTVSVWVKRTTNGARQVIWSSDKQTNDTGDGSKGGSGIGLQFWNDDQFYFGGFGGSFQIRADGLQRDNSAWYHIVGQVDTEQSTTNDRAKLWINGVQQTTYTSMIGQNTDVKFAINRIGVKSETANYSDSDSLLSYLDGYVAELHVIDGQYYDATYFGEFDNNGVWIPKKYTGSYGSDGYYLEFKQTGTSQNSSGIGADTSGNDNHFAVTNLAATDITEDTCTNNFCTMNPLAIGADATLSEGNCQIAYGSGTRSVSTANMGFASGKWYWEWKISAASTDGCSAMPGIGGLPFGPDLGTYLGNNSNGYAYNGEDGKKYSGGANSAYGDTFTTNDIISVAFDADNGNLYFYKNGTIQNSGTAAYTSLTSPSSGFYYPAMGDASGAKTFTAQANFGNPPYSISSGNSDGKYGNFEYAPPSGYYAICTKRLAEFG
jgi:hypothetical protein